MELQLRAFKNLPFNVWLDLKFHSFNLTQQLHQIVPEVSRSTSSRHGSAVAVRRFELPPE